MTVDQESGIEAGAVVAIGLKIGDLNNEMRRLRRDVRRLRELPVSSRVVASAAADASGAATLVLGGPTVGRQWEVRGIRVGGLTPSTTAAGVADVYISASGTPASTADWVDRASALPLPATYGAGELVLHERELLVLVVSGGTSGQVYVASAAVTDYDLRHLETEESL